MSIKISWQGPQVIAQTKSAGVAGLLDAAEYIINQANNTLTPHDEGTLQESGEASVDESEMVSVASYDTSYAARLHEHPEYHFQQGRAGKYLERTINEEADTAIGIVGARISEVLNG